MENRLETHALLPKTNKYVTHDINSSGDEDEWTDSCSSSYSESGR